MKTLINKPSILSYLFLTTLWMVGMDRYFAQSYEIKIMKIGKGSEQVFATDFYGNSLFFCSNAKAKKNKTIVNEDNSRFLNLYRIELDENLILSGGSKPILLSEKINSDLNEGPIFFNKETGEAYFSSNVKSDSTALSLAIFSSKFDTSTGLFSPRENVALELGDGNYSNPTVTEDGKMLIFSFTALTDTSSSLYYSTKLIDGWSTPLPIETLNTSSNESFPRIYKSTLYFASDRPGGMGGLDIYKSTFNGVNFENPKILPSPVNSEADDFLFTQISRNKGFLSSNRGQGTDRIYRFEQNLPTSPTYVETDINFCYTLQDETIQDKERYDYVWELGDGTKKNGAIVNHCFQDTGTYKVSCHLMDIETLIIEEDIMNATIEVVSELPLIRVSEYAGTKTIFLEQKWSRRNFTNFYWIVNDEVITDERLTINANHSKPYVVKAVLWNSENLSEVSGIIKTITPSE